MQSSFLNSWWQSFTDGSNKHEDGTDAKPEVPQKVIPDRSMNEDEEENTDESVSTPKVTVQASTQDVPSFALSTDEAQQDNARLDSTISRDTATTHDTTSSKRSPAAKSPATTTSRTPRQSPSSLMPPPSMKAPTKSLPLSDGSLRLPSNGPLPNRGPPSNSQQRAGSSGRGKVLLAPGHSPMDWASLARSKNLSGVPALQRVTPSQMKVMNGRKGKPIWSSYQGKVYNVTPYLPFHPGGEKELMKAAGRDGTKLFMEIHPWVNWEGMLSSCLVGILVSEEEANSSLDSLD